MGTSNGGSSHAGCFVRIIDAFVPTLTGHARNVVVMRFEGQLRGTAVAKELCLSRERVRQIEKKVITKIRLLTGILEPLVADSVALDLQEFNAQGIVPDHSMHFYQLLALRALENVSTRQIHRKTLMELHVSAKALMQSDNFILRRMTPDEFWEIAARFVPDLAWLVRKTALQLALEKLEIKTVGGVLVGRKPTIGKIIFALVRTAKSPIQISLLARQLEMVLAEYEDIAHYSILRLRGKLFCMRNVYFVDQNTVSSELQEPSVAGVWKDKLVDAISAAHKPYSLVSFRLQNPDCLLDDFSLASMLRDDLRVRHIGRRLYATAQWENERDVRVATLIDEALVRHRGPMTRNELLRAVRSYRDLRCAQIDSYLSRVPNLVRYTNDVVGLTPLTRSVMLTILQSEACVTSLLHGFETSKPVFVGTLWLLKAETLELESEEEQLLLECGKAWHKVSIEKQAARLYYEMRPAK